MTASKSQMTRQSVIAGTWYPGSETGLAQTVDRYLANVDQPLVGGDLLGLISPHAGYVYSGQTAAFAYRQLQGQQVDTVVLLGPSHRAWVGDYAVSAEDAYQTPLGVVSLDQAFIAALAERVSLRRVQRDAEHSLEIQLPFLQRQIDHFRLVPIMMSADDPTAAGRLAAALAAIIRQGSGEGRRTLLVASSDLHHIEDYREVVRRDRKVIDALDAYDLDRLETLLMSRDSSVCGRVPILTVLHAARTLGADAVDILHYTNSGEVTGRHTPGQYTVGYVAAAVYKSR
jgi:AmmeMemoRadiSam system protein B